MKKILVIDDSAEDRELLCYLVANSDLVANTTSCASGEEAIACLQGEDFDCILLDLRLEGEDGQELLEIFRRDYPGAPVIVLTGQGNEKTANAAFLAGAAYYLTKSELTGGLLANAISRVLHQSEIEQNLRRKQEASERASRLDAVGLLATGVAHDFNNQLATLRYIVELLVAENGDILGNGHLSSMQKVLDECQVLTSRMLSLGRKEPSVGGVADVGAVLNDLEALVRLSLPEQVGLKLEVTTPDLIARCPKGELLNCLINLTINARDAIVGGGSGDIRIIASSREDRISFCVVDSGPGMSPEVLERCVNPFFSTKPEGEGTGLGLSIIQGFATNVGGEFHIHSEVGKGTAVELLIPRAVDAGDAVPEYDAISSRQSPEQQISARVLIVDDKEVLARATKRVLEQAGFIAEIVTRGTEAIDLLKAEPNFDVLLTDIRLPEMNGFELAQQVHSMIPDMKVVYVTGFAGDQEFSDYVRLGPILQKPISGDELSAVITKLVSEG